MNYKKINKKYLRELTGKNKDSKPLVDFFLRQSKKSAEQGHHSTTEYLLESTFSLSYIKKAKKVLLEKHGLESTISTRKDDVMGEEYYVVEIKW